MKKYQKIIKYCAIAFAIFLIYEIVFGLASLISSITNIGDLNPNVEEVSTKSIPKNINKLDIDLAVTDLKIEKSKKLEISANDNIKVSKKDKTLYIEEKSKKILNRKKENNLTLYVPEGLTFEYIKIDTGAGKLEIEELNTKVLEFELGAGNVDINTLNVNDTAKMDTGAGSFIIKQGTINNLDLDMGLGSINITTKLLGNNSIDRGVGKINLTLLGNQDDYKINIDKGLGTAKINNDKITNNQIIGEGDTEININSGIGTIEINYKDN